MINDNSASILSKASKNAHMFKNAGVTFCDYVEKFTSRLFIKIAALRQIAIIKQEGEA